MKAAVVPAIGGIWRLEDVPALKPEPNQVLIRIRASGLCYTDVHMTNGALYQFSMTMLHNVP
jgi:alcohol dehydrogenase